MSSATKCGECTVCCTLSVIKELDKKAWETCKFCNRGCTIYNERPQECRDFECAYLQAGKDIELRPDKCGIMFFKNSDEIFTGVLVPGVKVTDKAKGQIHAFNNQGISVVLFKAGEKKAMVMAPKERNKTAVYAEYLSLITNGDL